MGDVYLVLDSRLGRRVALKVLPPQFAADPERKRRFQREAWAASALNHPNIVTVYDFSSDGKLDYLVMEYVPGKPLDRRSLVTGSNCGSARLRRPNRRCAGLRACRRNSPP